MSVVTKTILLVEDNEHDVFFMKRGMKTAEILNPLQVANDGQEAVDYLAGSGQYADRTRFPLPCLVLLDLKLPNKGGLDVLAWIRNQPAFRTLIVIVLTTSKEPSDIEAAYRLGANSYLVKPNDVTQLIEILKVIKQYWLSFNEFAACF